MLIHVVADYGAGDLAFAEVHQRMLVHVPDAVLAPTPVPPFDTLAAGFCVAQLALGEGPPGRVVFHNVAPRADLEDPRPGNEGERLVATRTDAGALVVGVNAGHAFSFLRGEVDGFAEVDVPALGSQFRSRDLFPRAVAELLEPGSGLGTALPDEAVPPPPESAVAYTDGYGNLKTTITEAPVASGTAVEVRIGERTARATVSDGTFEVPDGEMSLAPGSSGWPLRAGGDLELYELLLRGASAAERLGFPASGTKVEVSTL